MNPPPIFLFTDFGPTRLYTGQVHAAIHSIAPAATVIDLLDDAPAFDIRASAELLAATLSHLPRPAVVVAVVDPGVGGAREALIVEADGRCLVGPDNGLFDSVNLRARRFAARRIEWRPAVLSQSFHGRDLFAPIAARLALAVDAIEATAYAYTRQTAPVGQAPAPCFVVYIDSYGNCMTNLYAAEQPLLAGLSIDGVDCPRLQRFEQAAKGSAFCYENSLGLLEIAVNQGSAAALFGLQPGSPVSAPAS